MHPLDPKFTQILDVLLDFADTQPDAQRVLIEECALKLLRKWDPWVEHSPTKTKRIIARDERTRDERGEAEQKLSSMLRYGKLELALVANRLDIPMKKILEMRSGNYYGDETMWIIKTLERLKGLVRNNQV